MDDQHTIPTHYAILIGINAYPSSPLESCVRDVQKIKECLESKLPRVDIRTLTASGGDTPLEHPESWPTCHNITSALELVTSRAQPGDFIYIHYSGHGTRLDPCYELSNQSTGDLALVLLDEDSSRARPLPGPRLAGLLKSMVDKALVITLVLDCCFSASVYRNGDSNVRYLSCGRIGALTYPLIPEYDLADGNTRSTSRDASMRDNWLLDPNRYSILAACGPHENAKVGFEANEKGERYGALSYFLFKALSDYGLGRRHKDIHRHLCARFWESCQVQHPVLFGNEDQAFFGRVDPYRNARSTYVFERDGSLRLLAGLAHGLRDGDRFVLSPFGPTSDRDAEGSDRDAEGRSIAKITRTWPLKSELELLGTPHNLKQGWIAEPLTCSYLSNFPIRPPPELSHQYEWRAALEERSLGICIDNEQTPALQVVLSNNIYEILDEYGRKIINLPAMPRDQTDISRVCNILEHLARFRMAKDITNEMPTAAFTKSLDIRIRANGKAFGPGEQIEVRHGSIVELVMKNAGEIALYVHVYNLGPLWQIKGILHASYEAIPERNNDLRFTGVSPKKIKMTVPPAISGYGSCEDVIKVFVTSQLTSFGSLELPNLDELGKTNVGDRVSRPSNDESDDWMALNFPIRTLL
ncbi:MAG: hypothetical protein HETSPECPRED_003035 [Heterodermia speciosa]|uniref:Peptidase C14 caspase domain-containing protein n=1 Tax=Heterodermia speciosa TaxID=116794 RepID=A0A8H3J654_9LECA|nr:MAG: hypothetical protein HETSPECPRED_003035 [Heterodermia speciosa]